MKICRNSFQTPLSLILQVWFNSILVHILKVASIFTILLSLGYTAVYSVGDTISAEHQNTPLNVCYGDYPNEDLQLSDFNGDFNGGQYSIVVLRMTSFN